MTRLIRTKPEALYCVGVPLMLFLLLNAIMPVLMNMWLGAAASVLLACIPTAALVLGRWQWGRADHPVLKVVSTLVVALTGVVLGLPLFIANLIALCQDRYPLDPLSPLRIRPLIYGVGIALLLSGLLDTLLAL